MLPAARRLCRGRIGSGAVVAVRAGAKCPWNRNRICSHGRHAAAGPRKAKSRGKNWAAAPSCRFATGRLLRLSLGHSAARTCCLNWLLGWWWADAAAALIMVPIIAREGLQGLRGEACDDCGCAEIVESHVMSHHQIHGATPRIPNLKPQCSLCLRGEQKFLVRPAISVILIGTRRS